jgi:Fatty acid hydroxylase superfamily
MKNLVRFARTADLFLIVAVGICAYQMTLGAWPWAIAGILGYAIMERKFHRDMHELKWSPFHGSHMRHHDEPTPETGVPYLWVQAMFIAIAVCPMPYRLTGFRMGVFACLLAYEWVHFLCHCNYRPKTKMGWRIRVNHLKHHNHDPDNHYGLLFVRKPKAKVKA